MRKNMNTIIEYAETNSEKHFEDIKDKCCFYSGGVLYMKIFQQDLKHYEINNVNAISILNAGLTFFESDETVIEATKQQINK